MPAARARIAARALSAAAILALTGCSQVDAALSQQWAVVNFKPTTTVSYLIMVRQACSHVPNVRPLAPSSASSGLLAAYSVRYQTSNATSANLVALKACLQRFSAVSGVSFRDAASKG